MARKSKVRKSKRSMKGGNAAAAATETTTSSNVVAAEQASKLSPSPVAPVSAGAPVTTDDATKTALKGGSANGVVNAGATTGVNGGENAVTAGTANTGPVGPVPQPSEAVRVGSALAPSKFGGSKTLKGGKKAGSKRTRSNSDGKAYCVKCKKMNTIKNCVNASASNGRKMIKGTCAKCGTKMNKFV